MQARDLIKTLKHAVEHGRDMAEISLAKAALVAQGAGAVEHLLSAMDQRVLEAKLVRDLLYQVGPHLSPEDKLHVLAVAQRHAEKGQEEDSRVLAMKFVADHVDDATHAWHALMPIIRDSQVPTAVRAQAVRALSRARLDKASLLGVLALTADSEELVALAALDLIETQAENVDSARATKALLELLFYAKGGVRRRAIELLGTFGEVDLVERSCALPVSDPKDIEAVQNMVHRVLSKPRNLLHISPTSFEHLISRLLMAMRFEEVTVTGGPHDDGVDLTAIREHAEGGLGAERRRYIVQCKRHSKAIGPQLVEEFVNTLKERPDAHGLFIATAPFTSEARKATGAYRVELVDRDQLQQHLDKHFGSDHYRITPRS